MKYVALTIILIINIVLIISVIKYYFSYKRDEKQPNIIIWNIFFMCVAILGFLFFMGVIPIILIFYPNITIGGEPILWYEGLLSFLLLAIPLYCLYLFLFFKTKNWKVEIFENHIKYYNMFGKVREYKFEDVEVKYYSATLRVVKPYTKVVKGKRKKKYKTLINISYFCQNYENLYKAYKDYKNLLK